MDKAIKYIGDTKLKKLNTMYSQFLLKLGSRCSKGKERVQSDNVVI